MLSSGLREGGREERREGGREGRLTMRKTAMGLPRAKRLTTGKERRG